MEATAVRYCKTIRKEFARLYAAWPPNAPLRLGDFGYVRDGVFDRKSNLVTFGMHWKARKGDGEASYSLTSASGTQVRLLARGELEPGGVPVAKARAEVSFAAADAVFFNAAGCTVGEVEDQIALGREILSLFGRRQWNDDWYVVTRIVQAESSTIATAQSAGASIRLEARGDEPQIDLANAGAKLVAASRTGVRNVIVSEEGLTPLIGLSRVRRRILRSAVFNLAEDEQEDAFVLRERLLGQGASMEDQFEFVEADDER